MFFLCYTKRLESRSRVDYLEEEAFQTFEEAEQKYHSLDSLAQSWDDGSELYAAVIEEENNGDREIIMGWAYA